MRRSRDHDNYGQNFSYDASGSLIGVTDTASNTLFSASYYYSAKPLQYSTTDMDLGTWSYSYNSLGELVSWTDAKSQSFSQTYDALSRVTSRTEYEGTTTWTWGTSSGSHNIGRLAGVSMTGYSEALSYDSVGRLGTRSITADSNTYDIDVAYNNQGLPDTLTYPTSTSSTRVKVKYGYAYGILQSVTDWTSGSAGTVYWTANAQNVRGQTTQETLGNGVVTNRGFDAVTGWLNTIQSGVSGGTGLQNQSYAYDKIGNVTQRQENTLGLTENFYYDNLYRMTSSQVNSNTAVTYAYDAMGNITSRSDVNGNAAWTYDGSRKHAATSTGTGGATFGYDANGNMTSRDGSTIGWTSYNYASTLATATESTTFTYGPDRQYYKQDYSGPSGSETTYYIGGLLEKVSSGGVTDWRHYIVAEGQTVAIVSRKSNSTNAVNYPLEDHQSSSSVLTDGSGSNLVRVSYNAFGLPRDGSDWDGAVPSGDLTTIEGISRRGYTSHSMLGRMGLIHMNGRVQDATLGRFLSADPYVGNPGFTQNYNRYAYVYNNPLSFIDPSGFLVTCTVAPYWQDVYEVFYRPGPKGGISEILGFTGRMWYEFAGTIRVCIDDGRGDETPSGGSGGGRRTGGSTGASPQTQQPAQQPQPRQRQTPYEPQSPSGFQCTMEAPLVYAESKMGAFGEGKISTPVGKIHVNLDVASVNQSTTGENYLSQGFNLELRVFKWEIGFGINRNAPIDGKPGKPNWESPRVLLGFKNLSLSTDGLDWSVGGGIFVGFNAGTSPIKCGGIGQ